MRLGKTRLSKEEKLKAEELKRQEEKLQRQKGVEDEWMDSSITFYETMGQSFTSVASSVTSPPSYSGIAFAKYLQGGGSFSEGGSNDNSAASSGASQHQWEEGSGGGSAVGGGASTSGGSTVSSADRDTEHLRGNAHAGTTTSMSTNMSTGASVASDQSSKKSKKKKKMKKKLKKLVKRSNRRSGFFGSISEEEGDIDVHTAESTLADESAAKESTHGKPPMQQRRRRRSLFGNMGGSSSAAEAATSAESDVDHAAIDAMHAGNRSVHSNQSRSVDSLSGRQRADSTSSVGNKSQDDDSSAARERGSQTRKAGKPRRRRSLFGSVGGGGGGGGSKSDLRDKEAPLSSTTHHHEQRPKHRPVRRRSLFGGVGGRSDNHGEGAANGIKKKEKNKSKGDVEDGASAATRDASEHAEAKHSSKSSRRRRRHSISGTSSSNLGMASTSHTFNGIDDTKSNLEALRCLTADIHRVVNQERVLRKMQPFSRNVILDAMASDVAYQLASTQGQSAATSHNIQYHGNIGQGTSLDHIHATMMKDLTGTARKNILSSRFTQFGMALTKGMHDDKMYLCQLFKQ